MSDGADIGVTAGRALDTILGGKESPTEEEFNTPEQVRERIMAAPSPLEGLPIFGRKDVDAYSLAADCIAKAFILAEEESPGILDKTFVFNSSNTDIEDLWGKQMDAAEAVWQYISDKWIGFDDWIGGASGFMVGFAYNTARYVNSKPPAPNPALLTIEVPDE